MAQPFGFLIKYLDGLEVEAGVPYNTSDIITSYPTATLLIMKTRCSNGSPIKAGVNKGIAFEIEFNEHASISADGTIFIFNQDCTVAICEYVSGAV